MLPAGKPAKSAASQPLVDVLPSPSWRSTTVTAALVTAAGIGLLEHAEVDALHVRHLAGRGLPQRGRAGDQEGVELERLHRDVVPGGAQRVGDVVDRRVVARRARCPRVAVGVGDLLERLLVGHHALDGDALQQLADVVVRAVALGDACTGGAVTTAAPAARAATAPAASTRRVRVMDDLPVWSGPRPRARSAGPTQRRAVSNPLRDRHRRRPCPPTIRWVAMRRAGG